MFAAGRDSGRVPPRTRAKNWSWITCTRADAESARAAASSTPHAAAPARTIGRWGPHGPRWAAESAEMAQFLMSEAPHPPKTCPGAVSRARLQIARNECKKCAISATLSVPPFGYTHVDLRWPWGGVLGVGVVTRHAARCRAGARETSKFASSCTPSPASARVGLGDYVAAMGPVRVRDKHNAPRGAAGTHAHASAPRR